MPIKSDSPLARIERAIFLADKEGNIDDIRVLKEEYEKLQSIGSPPIPPPAGPGDPPGVRVDADQPAPTFGAPVDPAAQPVEGIGVATGQPTMDALLQGLSLGTYDELQAGTGAAVDKLRGMLTGKPVDFMDRYREYHQELGAGREAFEEQRPGTSLAYEVGGGLLSGGGLLGMGKAGISMGRLAAEGAGVGAVAGAATAEPGERLGGLAGGAAMGGAAGVVAPAVVGAGKKAIGAFKKGRDVTAAKDFAKKKVAKELGGLTPAQASAKMKEMGPDATLADVGGKDVEALAFKVANTPGNSSDMMENFLEERTKGEYQRIMGRAKELLGTKKEYFSSIEALKEERKAAAGPLYKQARATTIQMTDKLRDVLKLPTMKAALKSAVRKAADDGVEIEPGVLDMTRLDYTKRALDDLIGPAIRAGKSDRIAQLTRMKKRLLKELDAQSDAYSQARAIWSGSKDLENAIEQGAMFAKGESDVVAREVAAMTPTQRDAFRIGAMRGLRNQIAKTRDTNSIAMRFQNPAMRERMGVIFPTPEAFDDFLRTVSSESRYTEVRNRVLRGSQTAPRQRREGIGADVGSAVAEGVFSGGMPLANVARSVARRVGVGPSPMQAEEIARLLTTPGQRLGRQVPLAQAPQGLAELLMRRSGGALGAQGGLVSGR